ncbi:polysaccharide biosynthesis tyrosine autokinase [Psychrobacter urativorans]|uniref:polysaccharide biosynthesis tyrosine autokinase n=1 Tax=Psychrobacter urativorans TaxID=45610 RepID=UPI001919D699|nr:polysaccharide biosynthesis tyrosine autokinase [Psychrobacter urativorans]
MNTDIKKLPEQANNRDNNEIDLSALFWLLLRGWKVIIIFALLGLALGLLYSRYVNPTFKADGLVQIDEKSKGIEALGENISDLIGSEVSKAQTETELIKSRMVLEPVVNLLHLGIRISDPTVGYVDRLSSSRIHTQVNTPEGVILETEEGQVRVSQFNVSQEYSNTPFTLVRSNTGFVLSNDFDDFKGQLNQPHQFRGVDGIIQITVEDLPNREHPISITKQSLQTTTDDINAALTVIEKGQKTGIIELSLIGHNQQQVTLVLNQIIQSYVDQNKSRGSEETTKTLEFMETQIPSLREKLEDSEAIFNKFREENGTIDVSKESELLLTENSKLDEQLSELKLKRADLTTYYTEEHPLVIQINDQLKVLNNRKQEIDNTITGLPKIQREFLKLSEDTGINREVYLTMLKNYEQLKIVKAGQIGFARIIDLPISTYRTIAPKKMLIMLLALLLGTMLGTILVLLRSLLKNTVKDPERLESKTGIPVIATIPRSPSLSRLSKSKTSNRLLAYIDHNSLSYEAIKSLRTNLMFSMPKQASADKRAQVILISGESPGVGKSFISGNLAEIFSQLNKKVLIIDADMRLGELHKVFNTSPDNGLGDYLSREDSDLSNTVHPTFMDYIDFIPRGKQPHNPTSLLASEKFSSLMTELKAHYDYIIMDSPPVLAASDAIILSAYADKVLMVTRYNRSIEGQLAYAIKQLNKANVQVDGIILNDVQQGIMDKYSYHYSYAYGNNQQVSPK